MIRPEFLEEQRKRVFAARENDADAEVAVARMIAHAETQPDPEHTLKAMADGYIFACDRIKASEKARTN